MRGVFAVNKPKGLTSAQTLEQMKRIFLKSTVFSSTLERQEASAHASTRGASESQRRKALKKSKKLKMGHGGTLDPMATGVLIVGIGQGTKELPSFLSGTKTYEAVALLGSSTDTYDAEGMLLKTAKVDHITERLVESCLDRFRGEIEQTPPLYSALHMDGMRLYDYAREGKPLPRPIPQRRITVSRLECTAYTHDHSYSPPKEMAKAENLIAERLIRGEHEKMETLENGGPSTKRERLAERDESVERDVKRKRVEVKKAEEEEEAKEVDDHQEKPPAITLECQVSSGTYIRSLVHDMGLSLGSAAHMVALKRQTQGPFELGKNVIEWEDILHDNWQVQVMEGLDID